MSNQENGEGYCGQREGDDSGSDQWSSQFCHLLVFFSTEETALQAGIEYYAHTSQDQEDPGWNQDDLKQQDTR